MIHIKALPGSPLGCLRISQITEEACREAAVYLDAGVDGLIVENMHDVPYSFSVGPEVSTCMTVVCSAVRSICPRMPLGVQILSSANQQAMAVALASDLIYTGRCGLLNACAGDLLRYRKQIGAENVQVFTDIKKKHSSHALTSDVTIKETARAAEFFLSDGLILTGSATGQQPDPQELTEVSHSVGIPVLIGSGVTYDNVESYLDASGMIIGSHFKQGGHWANALDPERVGKFMGKIRDLRP
uniref:Zgc:162297 n=1 Tax=Nothobranchius furzeri TaxID=105023 RepID=A0A8C6LZZ8_NOTFU